MQQYSAINCNEMNKKVIKPREFVINAVLRSKKKLNYPVGAAPSAHEIKGKLVVRIK